MYAIWSAPFFYLYLIPSISCRLSCAGLYMIISNELIEFGTIMLDFSVKFPRGFWIEKSVPCGEIRSKCFRRLTSRIARNLNQK